MSLSMLSVNCDTVVEDAADSVMARSSLLRRKLVLRFLTYSFNYSFSFK